MTGWKFHQNAKSGRYWAWDGSHISTSIIVRIQIWYDVLFGKPVITMNDELFK